MSIGNVDGYSWPMNTCKDCATMVQVIESYKVKVHNLELQLAAKDIKMAAMRNQYLHQIMMAKAKLDGVLTTMGRRRSVSS